jgi:ribosomal protein S18 acetylase RimI-like enzyme
MLGMASITLAGTSSQASALRPLNILHDLPQVADLIELCFESSMDDDGQSYLQQLRRAGSDQAFLGWAARMMDSTSMPLSGYVWEEGGRIVGNASLVFQSHQSKKIAMIANVATHPDYRRRGIGRALTESAMDSAGRKGAREFWLHVRHDNPTAIKIYTDLGFVERARRTTYNSKSGLPGSGPSTPEGRVPEKGTGEGVQASRGTPLRLTRPGARHWPLQQAWLQRAHPDELSWYSRWDWSVLGPGLSNFLRRMLVQYDGRQWAAARDGRLLATVTWMPTMRASSSLWLAAPPDGDAEGVRLALETARRELAHFRKLTIEYPAGEVVQAIESAGFEAVRSLIWMRALATVPENPRISP